MDAMDVEAAESHEELRQGVEHRLLLTPFEALGPIGT